MRLLGSEDRAEAPLFQRQHVDSIRFRINACRVAHDIDKSIKRVQATEKVIVFAIGARQKRGEVTETDALQTLNTAETCKCMGFLRTDAIDQNFVELADFSRERHRE